MKKMSNQLVFFGTEKFSAQVLTKLIETGFQFEAIITKPDTKRGRGQRLSMPMVKKIGLDNKIPVFQPKNSSEMTNAVNKTSKFAGILVSFGKIIPESIINSFELGIINLHPSLLPKYRGPSPIESAILNGDQKTGVSIMSLSGKMDAGPIYSQLEYSLNDTENSSFLYQKLANVGADELIRVLPNILNKELRPIEQNDQNATYCPLLSKNVSFLDHRKTALNLERQVRAFEIYPRSRFKINNLTIIVTKAKVSPIKTKLSIKTAENYLKIEQLIAPSGKKMTAEAFANGYL